ncbi:hypothetical protein ACFFSW_15440 [Saccharothrix longispora]|uniref:Secreted protein n=1 Tax=Saccharothrix longispora TaxID=33920 RepID=A0ABU1PZJ0_9PSEU|nr:hypothetical protein [Saccharothrix longispora]MDR6596055.1 hypothetical protein [Saccharothrix longispora]
MRSLLATVLVLAALPATTGAASADPEGLRSCGTSVEESVGNGWCSGSGTFRVVVACDDNRFARSPWITISGGKGTIGVSCHGPARAVGAEVEEA